MIEKLSLLGWGKKKRRKTENARLSAGGMSGGQDASCFDNTAVLTLPVNYDDLQQGEVGDF